MAHGQGAGAALPGRRFRVCLANTGKNMSADPYIEIQYYASLREQRGVDREQLSYTPRTALDWYAHVSRTHGFTLLPENLRVACNDRFVAWTHAVQAGDRLAFIPPVAGG